MPLQRGVHDSAGIELWQAERCAHRLPRGNCLLAGLGALQAALSIFSKVRRGHTRSFCTPQIRLVVPFLLYQHAKHVSAWCTKAKTTMISEASNQMPVSCKAPSHLCPREIGVGLRAAHIVRIWQVNDVETRWGRLRAGSRAAMIRNEGPSMLTGSCNVTFNATWLYQRPELSGKLPAATAAGPPIRQAA